MSDKRSSGRAIGGAMVLPISTKGAVLAGFLGLVVFLFIENGPSRLPLHIDGTAKARYSKVKEVFTQNFIDGWERGGASLTVYVKGEKVVDLWGGYADRSSLRKWQQDTMQVVFSTTKGVASVCIAILVDRGFASYDDLVSKHWPAFEQNGKENITIQMVLSHQVRYIFDIDATSDFLAGLSYLDEDVTVEEAADHTIIARKIEKQRPHWPPGTATAYHIYTFGWLADQLIRHIDPSHRGIGQFVREEIHDAHSIDFHLGLPREETYRVARLTPPSLIDRISEISTDYRVSKYLLAFYKLITESMLSKALRNLEWLECVHQMTVNNPDYWQLQQAAALGVGNARALAQIFDLVVRKQLLSQETLSLLQKPHTNETDQMMGDRLLKGNGLFFMPLRRAGSEYSIGHTGHGCQQVSMDVGNEVAIGYTANGMKTALGDLCRTWRRLQTAIYDVIEEAKESSTH